MIQYIILGGPMMIPIGLVSIVALAVCIEKSFSLARLAPPAPAFFAGISESIRRRDWPQALIICRNSRHPLAQIFDAGLSEIAKPSIDLHAVEEAVKLKGDAVVLRLESGLKFLGSLVTILPLLGFLGTIIGLIGAFQEWQALGAGVTVSELAGGMYQAMVTTAAGLILAIPYYLLHHWFAIRLEAGALGLSQYSTEFILKVRQAVLASEETRNIEIEKPAAPLPVRR